jgi:hypothetical protein
MLCYLFSAARRAPKAASFNMDEVMQKLQEGSN